MYGLIEIILPVFLIIGSGYLAVYIGWFSANNADALMHFTQRFAIPCLLFQAIVQLDLSTAFKPELLASYYLGSIICFILGILGARLLFDRRPGEAVAIGFVALFSNSVLLGLPIMQRAYGVESLQANYAIIAIHAPFCYILGITTMEFARADGRRFSQTLAVGAKAIFSNALTLGLLLGFIVNLTGLHQPAPFSAAIDMMAGAALPAALFSLGGIMVRYRLHANLGEVAMVCALSLILHPSIAYVLSVYLFDLPLEFIRAAVVTAAMAPGANAFVFANMYGRAKNTAASSILLATALSVFSVTFWLWVLGS